MGNLTCSVKRATKLFLSLCTLYKAIKYHQSCFLILTWYFLPFLRLFCSEHSRPSSKEAASSFCGAAFSFLCHFESKRCSGSWFFTLIWYCLSKFCSWNSFSLNVLGAPRQETAIFFVCRAPFTQHFHCVKYGEPFLLILIKLWLIKFHIQNSFIREISRASRKKRRHCFFRCAPGTKCFQIVHSVLNHVFFNFNLAFSYQNPCLKLIYSGNLVITKETLHDLNLMLQTKLTFVSKISSALWEK